MGGSDGVIWLVGRCCSCRVAACARCIAPTGRLGCSCWAASSRGLIPGCWPPGVHIWPVLTWSGSVPLRGRECGSIRVTAPAQRGGGGVLLQYPRRSATVYGQNACGFVLTYHNESDQGNSSNHPPPSPIIPLPTAAAGIACEFTEHVIAFMQK